MKKKRIPAALLVVVLMVGGLWLLQKLVVPKYQTDIPEGSMIAEYYEDASNHEVIFLGDCEVYTNISTMTLWENYGITSYIRGSAQQLSWQSYYLLEDILQYETPKVVVFSVQALQYNTPQSEAYNRMSIEGMRWSMAKVGNIKASMTKEEDFIEYIFPLLRYHSRWSELTEEDIRYLFSRDLVTHNGYYLRTEVKPQMEFPEPTPLADYRLGNKAMEYLSKMTALCEEKGIELVLVKAPIAYPYWHDEWDAQVATFAKEHNLVYINYLSQIDEIGLDMSRDTYDGGLHLNVTGAEKLADYIGSWLVENYELTDYRKDEDYASLWQEKLERYNKAKEQ